MAGIENDLNAAQSDYIIAQKNYNSVEDMYKGGISSEKEYITAQKELQKAKSNLDKATNISGVYGSSDKGVFYIKAPITGIIVDKIVNPAMQLRADYSDILFTISDLKSLWVMANVFEADISKIHQNCNVEVTTLSYPDDIIKGKIDKIYDVLDPVSKVMKVRIKINNVNYLLKPGMFANVILHYAENINKLTIPSKAVIFDNSKDYVIVYKSKCSMDTREVKIYKSVNEKTYINSGLEAGEEIIVNNNLLIYDQLTD
jgi:cobalt-zinc-cadmium efflux system membrane fusion protein